MHGQKIIVDYENLLRARSMPTHAQARRATLLGEIRKDVSGEYSNNIDQKIERWIDVTRVAMWKDARSVHCYVQAKMLYRDAFYEAAIMVARSVCELVCYELFADVPHPFGPPEEIERVNFRRLASFLHENKHLPKHSFDLINSLY